MYSLVRFYTSRFRLYQRLGAVVRYALERIVLAPVLLVGLFLFLGQRPVEPDYPYNLPFTTTNSEGWAAYTLSQMTLEEKIGQLFMVKAWSAGKLYNRERVEELIREHHVGGLIFMQGAPMQQAQLANHYQQLSKQPLLVSQDAEWGLAMRLDSTLKFPYAMTLGAISNDSLLYAFGQALAEQCRAVGVQVNFAPVADINNNPENPVINFRSFGEDLHLVARKALMVMKGMQENGVMAVAKHFPGHGDTDVDSHQDLPVLAHDRRRLEKMEFYPFIQLVNQGVMGVMSAHLHIPAIDTTKNLPATLSPRFIKEILRDRINFEGLIFTDALDMRGVTKYFRDGQAEAKALLAGNDILLCPRYVPQAIETIKAALDSGAITQEQLDNKVLRILLAKEWFGLHKNRLVDLNRTRQVLNDPRYETLKRRLYSEALTVVRDPGDLLPLLNPQQYDCAYLQIGQTGPSPFYERLRLYRGMPYYYLPRDASKAMRDSLMYQLQEHNTVVVGLMGLSRYARWDYRLDTTAMEFVQQLKFKGLRTLVTIFGNPYIAMNFKDESVVVVTYENDPLIQEEAASLLFGQLKAKGHLPVHRKLQSYKPPPDSAPTPVSLVFAQPTDLNLNTGKLRELDQLLQRAVDRNWTPGLAVLAMKADTVFYHKGFGKTGGPNSEPVDPYTTVYDLASVTKVAATTLAVMHLSERNMLKLQAPVRTYLPETAAFPLGDVLLEDLLLHTSGLPGWIPFWKETVQNGRRDPQIYSTVRRPPYTLQIGPRLYLNETFPDTLWRRIYTQKLQEPGKYLYSDLGMITLSRIIEKVSTYPLDEYVQRYFYQPMGMTSTTFNPALNRPDLLTPPTLEDQKFRFATVEGYVNDEASALLGGVAGHAGLFSNVYDLAKLLTMLRNGGVYGGKRYLQPGTIQRFTGRIRENNRRGLGWDKPVTTPGRPSPAAKQASAAAYGHLGYTGTCLWVDPEKGLTYILLSNRTYPRDDKTFSTEGVRTRAMGLLYEALGR